jgi:ParB family chromosome partitioning protein
MSAAFKIAMQEIDELHAKLVAYLEANGVTSLGELRTQVAANEAGRLDAALCELEDARKVFVHRGRGEPLVSLQPPRVLEPKTRAGRGTRNLLARAGALRLHQPARPEPEGGEDFTRVEVSRVQADPAQVRQIKPPVEEDAQLAASVTAVGVLQPLLVRWHGRDGVDYQVVAGERRLGAARAAGLEVIPVRVIETTDEAHVRRLQAIENLQRQPLHPLDVAAYVKQELAAGQSVVQVEAVLHRGASWISHAHAIACNLSDEAKIEAAQAATIGLEQLYEITKLERERHAELVRRVRDEGLTVRELRQERDKKPRGDARPKQGLAWHCEHGIVITARCPEGADGQKVLRALDQARAQHAAALDESSVAEAA